MPTGHVQQSLNDGAEFSGALRGGVGLAGGVLGCLLIPETLKYFKTGFILSVDSLHSGSVAAHIGVILTAAL